jgi:hypothetical protein
MDLASSSIITFYGAYLFIFMYEYAIISRVMRDGTAKSTKRNVFL